MARLEAAKPDLAKFEAYLKANYPGRLWNAPALLDTPAVLRAYPGSRILYVGAAALPEGGPAKCPPQEELPDNKPRWLYLVVRITPDGTITPLRVPADYNVGLFPVASETDVKIAAAAVFALEQTRFSGPQRQPDAEVTVGRMPGGWDCAVKGLSAQGNIVLDGKGRVRALEIKPRAVATASK